MSGLSFSLNISKSSLNDLEKKLLRAIVKKFNQGFQTAKTLIEIDAAILIPKYIQKTPEYISLTTDGKLSGELGLTGDEATARFDSLFQTMQRNIFVKITPLKVVGDKIGGGLYVGMVRSGYDDILANRSASYKSNQYDIDWLDWLLTKGDDVIIVDYFIKKNLTHFEISRSRTGQAIMRSRHGDIWKMPSEFSGVIGNNFITRAFGENAPEFINEMKFIFEKALRNSI